MLGEHAHTVQPITRVNGKWVVYGMGNLVGQQEVTRPETYRGILVRFTFVERPDGGFDVRRAAYVPVGWNKASAGNPIRVRRLDEPGDRAARAAVVAAVNGLGPTPGLHAATDRATPRCRRCRPGGNPRLRRSGRRRRCRRT